MSITTDSENELRHRMVKRYRAMVDGLFHHPEHHSSAAAFTNEIEMLRSILDEYAKVCLCLLLLHILVASYYALSSETDWLV
jgi:hypothetical protein